VEEGKKGAKSGRNKKASGGSEKKKRQKDFQLERKKPSQEKQPMLRKKEMGGRFVL